MGIQINRTFSTTPDEIKNQLEEVLNRLVKQFGLKHHWENDVLFFTQIGLEGKIEIVENQIQIDLDTAFYFPISRRKLKALIEEEIDKELSSK